MVHSKHFVVWFGLDLLMQSSPIALQAPTAPLPFCTGAVDLDFLLWATTLAGLVCLFFLLCLAWGGALELGDSVYNSSDGH